MAVSNKTVFTKISNGPDLASEKYFAYSKHHYLKDDSKDYTSME